MKRIICTIAAVALVSALAWVGGFDFNERGEAAVIVSMFAVFAAAFVYGYPGWDKP